LLPEDERIDALSNWWVGARAEAIGIPLEILSPLTVVTIWRQTGSASTDTAANDSLLAVLQDIAFGNKTRAAKKFHELMVERALDAVMHKRVASAQRRQSERAKKPRTDELGEVILEIVGRRPDISRPELEAELDRMSRAGNEVIEELNDRYIFVKPKKGGKTKKIKRSGLASRLSRAKAKKNQKI
jgi:hypothetical protein